MKGGTILSQNITVRRQLGNDLTPDFNSPFLAGDANRSDGVQTRLAVLVHAYHRGRTLTGTTPRSGQDDGHAADGRRTILIDGGHRNAPGRHLERGAVGGFRLTFPPTRDPIVRAHEAALDADLARVWFVADAADLAFCFQRMSAVSAEQVRHRGIRDVRRQKRQAIGFGLGSNGAKTGGGEFVPSGGAPTNGGPPGTSDGGTNVFPPLGIGGNAPKAPPGPLSPGKGGMGPAIGGGGPCPTNPFGSTRFISPSRSWSICA